MANAYVLSETRHHATTLIRGATYVDQSPATHDHHFALTEFTNTAFIRCDLSEAYFSDTTLRHVVFSECDLSRAEFCASLLIDVAFVDCHMPATSFEAAAARDVSFKAVTNFSPILEAASLERAISFPGTDLAGVSFFNCLVGSDVELPPGYRRTTKGPYAVLDAAPTDLRRVIFDADYLSAFAPPSVVELLANEHCDLPVSHLIALLSALVAP